MAECGVFFKIKEPVKSFVLGSVTEYLGYIRSYEGNLDSLRKSLSDVCNKKDEIIRKMKYRLEEISREEASWLKHVRILSEDEELKSLMNKDLKTAKFVVKLMDKKDLKRSLSKEKEMQKVVVKVMKKLKKETEDSNEDTKKMAKVDYKKVSEVVVELMKDIIGEFKKSMKKDMKMAIMVTNMLNNTNFDKFTRGDKEMEGIVWEVVNISDEELWLKHEDVDVEKTLGKEVEKLLTPVRYLLIHFGKWVNDANFKNVVFEAEGVKLRLDVIDGLLIKTGGLKKDVNANVKLHKGYCYGGRYDISKAAQKMASFIQDTIICKYPHDLVKNLDSRYKLILQILEKLKDDQVDAVGLFGMGGIGKTTLAKEVKKRAKDLFNIRVMIEVSNTPNIALIQAVIAESINLPLHDIENVAQRATRLYNRLNSEKKILVILDNIWQYINLDEIGIPRTCKLLLTTRERDVCRVMGVRDMNNLEVGVLSTNEARNLLKSQTRNQIDRAEYINVVERLLSNCGGLPLAIVATAKLIEDNDSASWEKIADDLEKPISNQVSCDYWNTYSILDTSYKFIKVAEKRTFFLLACLFPLGSGISIESLTRYGIGLALFPRADNVSEAMEVADNWVNELISSSMLVQGDVKGEVMIHNIIRAFAILFVATEEKHKFLVDDIPLGLDNHTSNEYTAVSFMSRIDYSRLSEVNADKLRILKLRGELFSSFTDSFFEGMKNLEVLDLSNMSLRHRLPESMGKLKKLRTLCMEGCKLGDIRHICELVNLLVLSLRESSVEELPNDIEKLCKLRVLDLRMCTSEKVSLISVEVLGRLIHFPEDSKQTITEMISEKKGTSDSQNNSKHEILEMISEKKGTNVSEINNLPEDSKQQAILEMMSEKIETSDTENNLREDSKRGILEMISEKKGTSDGEKNSPSYLDVYEKHVSRIEELPINDLFIQNLNKFRVAVGARPINDNIQFCRVLNLQDIDVLDGFGRKSCLKSLLKKAEWLGIYSCRNFEHLVPQLDQDGFQDLSALHVVSCDDVKCIVKGSEMNDMVYDGEAPPGTFSNLQTLRLSYLDELEYVLPLALLPPNLNHISVGVCKSLNFIFADNGKTHAIELSLLKSLELYQLPNLLGLVGSHKFSNTSTAFFFDRKITFPSLKQFHLTYCNNVVNLWSNGIDASGFQNLKDLDISYCDKLMSVGPPSLFSSLLHLESLSIMWCNGMCEVITPEEVEETTDLERGEQIIRFHQLKSLNLWSLRNLKRFYGGESKLEFPKLKKLQLMHLTSMNKFTKFENSSALFHERVEIPSLEELHLFDVNDEVIALWDSLSFSVEQGSLSSNSTSMLRYLRINRTSGLERIPSEILWNLSFLAIDESKNDDVLFSKGCWFTLGQLSKLEELAVERCRSLRELFDEKDNYGADDAVTLFCGHLKKLKLMYLSKLNRIPMHLFKGLVSLTLHYLNWECVILADEVGESLLQLQYLSIDFCEKMKILVSGVLSVIEFRQLKTLRLYYLGSLINISSAPEKGSTLCLPSLESLEIKECPKLEHFWSGLIVAPRLQNVKLYKCGNMEHFLVGIPENMIELPSLEIVDISKCPDIQSFSHGRLLAPKLTKIQYDSQEYSMQDIGDLNVFLTEKHRSKLLLIDQGFEYLSMESAWPYDSLGVKNLKPSLNPSRSHITLKDVGVNSSPGPFQPDKKLKDIGMKSDSHSFIQPLYEDEINTKQDMSMKSAPKTFQLDSTHQNVEKNKEDISL